MTVSTFLPGTHIEIVAQPALRGHVRSALFDFDGTLSLIRQGWQCVMIPLMVEILRETTPTAEDDEVYGLSKDLHTIRPKLQMKPSDADAIMGKDICNWLYENYKWYYQKFNYQK